MKRKFKKFSAMLLSVATVMSFSVNSVTAMADFSDELRQQDIFDEDGFIDNDKLDNYVDNYSREETGISSDESSEKVTCTYYARVFIADEVSDLLFSQAWKDTGGVGIHDYDFAVDDLDIQLTLVETDEKGKKILNKVATWNAMEEPVKEFEFSCELAEGEAKYFEIFAENLPEGYADTYLDPTKTPILDGPPMTAPRSCAPRITIFPEQSSQDAFVSASSGGRRVCHLISLDISNIDELWRLKYLEAIYPRIKRENPGELYNMVKSLTDEDIEDLRATSTTITTRDTRALIFKDTTTTTTTATGSDATQAEEQTPEVTLPGDANCDGEVTVSDAVLIMQNIANPDEFEVTVQGQVNADVTGDGDGVTLNDALEIQQMSLYN